MYNQLFDLPEKLHTSTLEQMKKQSIAESSAARSKQLPRVLYVHIFEYLEALVDWSNLLYVCRDWKDAVSSAEKRLTTLALPAPTQSMVWEDYLSRATLLRMASKLQRLTVHLSRDSGPK